MAIDKDGFGTTVQSLGAGVHVQDYGPSNGKVIAISDGVLAPHQFDGQFEPLVEAGFRVISVTPRGMGLSDKPYGPMNLDVWADDFEAVLDSKNVQNAVLIGSTPLGKVAFRYLSRHGTARFDRLFVHAPFAFGVPVEFINLMKAGFRASLPDALEGLLPQQFGPLTWTDAQANFFIQMELQMPTRSWLAFADAVGTEQAGEMASVTIPTIGILGENDMLAPLAAAQASIDMMANAALVVVPGNPHVIQSTDLGAFNRELIAFASAANPTTYVNARKPTTYVAQTIPRPWLRILDEAAVLTDSVTIEET